jgi:acyl-CoA hydrolase
MSKISYQTTEEALSLVRSGDRVFVHGSAATPLFLVNGLFKRAGQLSDIELVSISTYGNIEWNQPAVQEHFRLNSLFVSANVREWVNNGSGGYVPIFLSEIPHLFEKGYLPLDVAMVHVSPPDEHGYCTLGTSVDAAFSAVRNAKIVIAQVNPQMPRVMGDGVIHHSRFDAMVWQSTELPEVSYATETNDVSEKIATYVAGLIDDGATLQVGIGSIPDAVLKQLTNHKGLGLHTEMFSDGVVSLVEKGIITNEHKEIRRGKIVSSFILGTRKVYDFVDNNPYVSLMSMDD